jgi:hypothetical protein
MVAENQPIKKTVKLRQIKVKVKLALEQAMKAQKGEDVLIYSFFNLGTRWGWVVNVTPRFMPGKETRYSLNRRFGGPQGRSGRVSKTSPPQEFFYFSFSLFLLLPTSFFVLVVLALPCLFTVQHTTQIFIRTRNPSKRSAAVFRLRPLGHWDGHSIPGSSSPQRVSIPRR